MEEKKTVKKAKNFLPKYTGIVSSRWNRYPIYCPK